jgi:hypothetical protein
MRNPQSPWSRPLHGCGTRSRLLLHRSAPCVANCLPLIDYCTRGLLHNLDGAMIVAVIAMRMMQMIIDEIVDMVTVRHRFMPTTGTVLVSGLVTTAIMVGRAALGVCSTDF